MSDLISKKSLLNKINAYVVGSQDKEFICKLIKEMPSAQQKKGRWVFDETLDRHYYCSECKSMGVDYWDYCPYCGADMRGEVNE